jgi:hypothetical protein
MNTTSKMLVSSIGVAVVASLFAWSAHGKMQGGKDKRNAFTYEMAVTYFANGVPTRSERVVRAVRKDGSFAVVTQLRAPNGEAFERHEIMDLEALRRSISYTGVDVVTTAPIPEKTAARLRADKGSRCGLEKGSKTSRIHGYDVIRYGLKTAPVPAEEALDVEAWLAPALGCEALRTTWIKGGKVVLSREVERIEIGDPPTALFQTQTRFAEVSPGRAAIQLAEDLGVGVAAPLGPIEQKIDDEYFRRRQEAGWD